MKNKNIVELLTPIHKINKVCAIHYAAIKNNVKRVVFGYSYDNIQDLMSNVVKGVKLDKKYLNEALVNYYLLKTNLDIAHEIGAISDQLVYKGTSFVGYFVKHDYLLPGKRLKRNAMVSETPLNYLGFLSHCRSFKFKLKLIHTE